MQGCARSAQPCRVFAYVRKVSSGVSQRADTLLDDLRPAVTPLAMLDEVELWRGTDLPSICGSCPVVVRRLFGRPAHPADQGW